MASVETFNELLLQFVEELAHTFPENTIVKTYRTTVASLIKKDPGVCLQTFVQNVKPHEDLIRNQDERIFEEFSKNYGILKSLDLETLWKSELSEKSRKAIWQYVQGLYVLGSNCDPEDVERSRKTNMDFSPEVLQNALSQFNVDGGDDGPLADVMKNLTNPDFMDKINRTVEEQFGDGNGGIDEKKILGMLGPLMGNLGKMFQAPAHGKLE